jgi:hypothetical protein
VRQAEAYGRDTYLMLRNDITDRIAEVTKNVLGRDHPTMSMLWVPDAPAFVEQVTRLVRGSQVLIALGDSVTANYSNWPFRLFQDLKSHKPITVINLADWGTISCDHVDHLAFILRQVVHSAEYCQTVFVCGLWDFAQRLKAYNEHFDITPAEVKLEDHEYGGELANLNRNIPTEREAADRWIARRTLAGISMLEQMCVNAGGGFTAVLPPICYEDYAPAYLRELRQLHAAEGASSSFEAWCRERRFSPDASSSLATDLRPVLDAVRQGWRRRDRLSSKGTYVDYTTLFFDIPTSCFDVHFDAVHYNPRGTELLANAIAGSLGWSPPVPDRLSHASEPVFIGFDR